MSFELIASPTRMVRHRGSGLKTKRNESTTWKTDGRSQGFNSFYTYIIKQNKCLKKIKVGKYVLIILKTMQFCKIVRFALTSHVVEAGTSSSSPPLLTFVQWWEVGPFQDFRTKLVSRSDFRTLLHTDRWNSEVIHDIYAKTGQSRLF